MCDPVAGTMAALSAAGGFMDAKNQNKAWALQETARRKQQMQMVRQANAEDAQLRLSAYNSFQQARDILEQENIGYIQAKSAVDTVINESNLEGRSMDRIRADVDKQFMRTKVRVQSNYETDYANIYADRESIRDNLIAGLEGMPANTRPNKLSQALSIATSAASGYQTGMSLKTTMRNDPNLSKFFK